ncbi:patatin-like phospholipase family protein [Xanthomonas sp. GPE 39]|uniref:patatin-like phospholipase family protein n=1 Tax=Xanthomonas sp. GPE 39 TaxID=1583099 RepID=UPI0005F2A2F7|nr:patatin-like phospholipase family protein [Xanthomonas sp. GPE 39]
MTTFRRLRFLLSLSLVCVLGACGGEPKPAAPAPVVHDLAPAPTTKPLRIGIALGGGAAKGFAHIGVIKMLQANGLEPAVVSGTSAGSVVGALYASGMDAFELQQAAEALEKSSIRDMHLFSGGLVQGQALQDYINTQLKNTPIEKLARPFAVVATRLEDGERTVFVRGNAGQAVRASSSFPGVFEPVAIGKYHYVDGGVVSPVPVDAARQLGADVVIAVDISSKASGKNPSGMLGIVNQSIAIMGQRLGQQELARADIVIRPNVNEIGATDFAQRNAAILEGEKATLAAMPQIKAMLAQLQQQRAAAAEAAATAAKAAQTLPTPLCPPRSRLGRLFGSDAPCKPQD